MSSSRHSDEQASLRVGLDMRLSAYRGGGIARYTEQLAAALDRLDEITLTRFYSKRAPRASGARSLRTPPHHQLETWTLPAELILSRAKLDIFHSPDFIAPRLANIARVATVHDLAFITWPEFLSDDALAYYHQLGESKQWTDGWIVPSHWTGAALHKTYDIPPERIEVIPHGVPSALLGEPPLPREERERFILAVGTVEPRKNYDLLLDALEAMADPPRLVIAGSPGWQSGATQDRIRRACQVEWVESPDDATLRRLYRRATALAIPSHAEGFGFAALEAMASGTPVISSGAGALPEVTGDAALVPAAGRADTWASEINRVLEDRDLWRRLSTEGARRAALFTWEETARRTADFYWRIASA